MEFGLMFSLVQFCSLFNRQFLEVHVGLLKEICQFLTNDPRLAMPHWQKLEYE